MTENNRIIWSRAFPSAAAFQQQERFSRILRGRARGGGARAVLGASIELEIERDLLAIGRLDYAGTWNISGWHAVCMPDNEPLPAAAGDRDTAAKSSGAPGRAAAQVRVLLAGADDPDLAIARYRAGTMSARDVISASK